VFCPEEFTQRLKQPEDRAQVVLNELITDGRVVLSPDIDGDARYELATDGHALAGATARQPVTRDTAQGHWMGSWHASRRSTPTRWRAGACASWSFRQLP